MSKTYHCLEPEEVKERIFYAKPSIGKSEISYVLDAVENGWGDRCYDYIKKFQNSFSEYINSRYTLATSSCTGALHLAYASINLKPDDEVIVPDITWIASVAPLTYLGVKPVFVDVLPDTWCIDPNQIKKAITSKTKAILAVHLYGNLAEMEEIMKIAKENSLYVIEDAAEALGSEHMEKKTGTMGDIGVFSFHGAKTMTTGEGGMIVTNNNDLFERITILSDHGRRSDSQKMFWCEEIGFKYKISNLQAALGLGQLERINDLINKKREVFKWYKEKLSDISFIKMNIEKRGTKNSYWMPTVILNHFSETERDTLIKNMKKYNIDTRPFFYPLTLMPMFKQLTNNHVSYSIYSRGINLPSFFDMTELQADRVINILTQEIERIKKCN